MNKVAVYGGLGNQMFQYAFYIALKCSGQKARLSFNGYFYYRHHNGFDLARAFKLQLPPFQQFLAWLLEQGSFLYSNKLVRVIVGKFLAFRERTQLIYKEKNEFTIDKEVVKQHNVAFYGTWLHQDYFSAHAEEIKKQFEFKKPKDELNKAIAQKIAATLSVSIHIRRGDYVTNKSAAKNFVIKDATYYNNAVAYLNTKISNATYFIFSDDMQWARENLTMPNCVFVDINSGKYSFYDMYLISICKHNIIANSTFSWWGAWLNNNKSKIVIVPEVWMHEIECPGMYPNEWIKIPV
jgi:hypothetical protein